MPPVATAVSPLQSLLPVADETQRRGRAVFELHHLTPERARVIATGDVDATNCHALGYFVQQRIRVSHQLVLDLSVVDFFGSQAFTALYFVGVHCTRRDVEWAIVGSRAVRRITRICDPEGDLPIVDTFAAAMEKLDRCAKCHGSPSSTRTSAASSTMVVRTSRQPTTPKPTPGDRYAGSRDVAAVIGGERRKLGSPVRSAQRAMSPKSATVYGRVIEQD